MTSFTNVFGGSPVRSSQVAYLAYNLTANTTLGWPSDATANPVARFMDVTTTAGLVITLPDATEVSNGQDMIFRNQGANVFTVSNASGTTVATVAVGQAVYLYLTDNTTSAGVWRSILFGVGASLLDAASLAGLGLIALAGTLAQAHPTTSVSANTTIDATYRAAVVIWTGGAGTFTLPTTVSVGSTFFFEVRNQGTGNLTLAPQAGELIDTATTISLQSGDSAFIHAFPPSNWYSVGRGRAAQFNFTQLVKTVTGGTATLSSTEAANVVQKYVGALTSNQTVVLPAVVQVYYVSNATTGAFSLTFQSPSPGSTVTVPSNQNAILFCDGTNVINASTTIAGFTSVILAQGSPTTPPLTFSGNVNTGIYQPATNTVAVTAAGTEVARFTASSISLLQPISSTVGAAFGGNLNVSGASTLQGISGTALTLSGGLAAATASTFGGTLGVTGNTTFAGTTYFGNAGLTAQNTFYAGASSVTVPTLNFDTGDSLTYNRGTNTFSFLIGSTAILGINASTIGSIVPFSVQPASGAASMQVTRASVSTGQTSFSLNGGTGSSNWQIYQQVGSSDLGFYTSALGGNALSLNATNGAATFAGSAAIGTTLSVTGAANLQGISGTALTLSGGLAAATASTFGSTLTVAGALTSNAGINSAPPSGTAVVSATRASLSTGQTSFSLNGGTGSSNWQIYQQNGVSDLGFYSSAYGQVLTLSATAGIATFAGSVAVPLMVSYGNVYFGNGTLSTPNTFYAGAASATVPALNFDTNDYLAYDRTANAYTFNIGGSAGLTVSGSAVTSALPIVGSQSIVSQPAAGSASIAVSRASLATGQTTINFNGGAGSSSWQILQQTNFSDLNFYSSAFGNYVMTLATSGASTFAGNVTATGYTISSAGALKNIQGDLNGRDAFDRVMRWMPKLYALKADDRQRIRAGLVVEEAPTEITDGEGHIDLYAALTEIGAALQYLARKVGAA